MNIGYVQFAPVLGDAAGTRLRLAALLDEAPEADLLVLPELCNSGYNFESREQAFETAEVAAESPMADMLTAYCVRRKTRVVVGINELDDGRLFNTALLLGPSGIEGKYRKLHLFLNERDYFEPGNLGLPVFDIGLCRIGILICFDWIFPETWRVLALQGADVICHPSNLVLPGYAQRAVPVFALVNRVFIVTANRMGRERDLVFTGGSLVADPRSEVLAQAPADVEHIAVVDADLSLARNKMVTPRNDVLGDRRPREYELLTREDSPADPGQRFA